MKTDASKKFDAVKMMRDIRNNIDQELGSTTPEERREYYKKQKEELEEWKKARRVRNA